MTSHPDVDILAPLHDKLRVLLKGLMISNPESFIIPKLWIKHRESICPDNSAEDSRFETVFNSIDRRNARLAAAGSDKDASPKRRLIQVLDTTFSKFFTHELVKETWNLDADKYMLIQTILEWSTSSYRPGVAKIYIAARIFRQWSRYGADITDAILTFLDSKISEKGRNKAAFYHLLSELARSDTFSTSIYLQWLIARGGLHSPADVAPTGPCATRLVAELPTHNLSEGIIYLRMTLLNRVGFSVDEEEDQMAAHQLFLNKQLPGMQANVDNELGSDGSMTGELIGFASDLSRTTKSEIGLWIRQKVNLQMLQPTIPPLDDWDDAPMKGGTSAITPSDFNLVRKYLEFLEDYSMLADVLKIVTSSNDSEVLASCADTLNLNSSAFSAIGALSGLFEALMNRLRSLGDDESFPRVLLVSLTDLAAKIPEQKTVGHQLALELARSDRKTAADACSPVSDHMAGVIQTAEADFTDEIEKILASGNSMDQATLGRLFQRIALRLEDSWEKSPEQQRSCGLLLTRLRTFDAQQFDILLRAWVKQFLMLQNRPGMIQVLGPLISFGCLSLRDIVSITNTKVKASDILSTSKISRELLALLITPTNLPEAMTVEETYRLRIKQMQMQMDHPLEMLPIIYRALDNTVGDDITSTILESNALLLCHDLQQFLQRIILVDTESTIQILIAPLSRSNHTGTTEILSSLVNKLLSAEDYVDVTEQIRIESVLGIADEFTLPFCQVKLASMFKAVNVANPGEAESEHLQTFDKAIASAVEAENISWACIIPLLDPSIANHLRTRAESQFLALFPSPKNLAEDLPASQARIKQAENLLYIINASAFSISPTTTSSTLPSEIVAAFNSNWLLLSSQNSQAEEIKGLIIQKWLPLLISFVTIHVSVFEASKAGHENRARTLLSLAAILLELCALPCPPGLLIEQIFDIALQLVDGLPDDFRQQCIRGMRDTICNPRVSYMFSYATNPSEWLVLSQKERLRGAAVAEKEKLSQFPLRRWEMLGEPTPNVGENDTSLSLTLFGARRG
jgi:mediator of RNA polymerase II transcription subunit 12